jgi:hypothetical protein
LGRVKAPPLENRISRLRRATGIVKFGGFNSQNGAVTRALFGVFCGE